MWLPTHLQLPDSMICCLDPLSTFWSSVSVICVMSPICTVMVQAGMAFVWRKEAEQSDAYHPSNLLRLQVAVSACLLWSKRLWFFLICVTGSTFHHAVFLGFGAWVGPEREVAALNIPRVASKLWKTDQGFLWLLRQVFIIYAFEIFSSSTFYKISIIERQVQACLH